MKSTLAVIVLISIISGILTSVFIVRQKNLFIKEHRTRIQVLGENLVNDLIDIILRNDQTTNTLWYGVVRIEEDVTDAFVVNKKGNITNHIRADHHAKRIAMPAYIDTLSENNWFPTDEKNKLRLFLPIDINKETYDGTIHTHGNCGFPYFTHDSKEVTFFCTDIETGVFNTVSKNIESKKVRRIFEKGVSFWSHDGRYLACNIGIMSKKPADLAIYDTQTDETRVIARETNWPANCFSADDKYVITTIRGNERGGKLVRIPFEGGEPEQLTFHSGSHWYPNCSSDGKWLIYSIWPDMELWVYNFESKKSMRVFPELESRHISGTFSPDSKKICYLLYPHETPDSSRYSEVYVADFPDGINRTVKKNNYGKKLAPGARGRWYTDWSPDGTWIAYNQQGDIWIVPAEGGEPENLTDAPKKPERLGYVVLDVSTERLKNEIRKSTYKALFIMLIVICFGIIATIYVEKKHTELEKAHRELGKAYKELERLDRAKDEFLSLVSHELRTPLGSMLLHAEMLLNRRVKSEEKQMVYHENIVNQCKRLTRLVNDVLDLSKIEAGRMTFTFEPLRVRELLSDMYSALRPSFDRKNIRFDYEAVPDTIFLMGDRDKILQVLTNIITNALKFTPEGGSITVALTVNGEMGTIAVKDTGPGIQQEDIPKVFDRFSQLEDIDYHSEGTGLGMTISKSIIEHHGGSIWIESELGKGTTVFFTLPLSETPPEQQWNSGSDVLSKAETTEKSSQKPAYKKLLIVDDEKSYRQALTDCVQDAGYESLEAADGNEALSMVHEHRPVLIILDVMMRGLSGLDVCRMLREDPETSAIKIIMLSARGQEKEKEEGLEAGADRYMTKPFDYKELIKTIEELLGT